MDIRGNCQRTDCIYNYSGYCDIWYNINIAENIENCDSHEQAEN